MGAGTAEPNVLQSWATKEEYLFEIWHDQDSTLMDYYSAESFFPGVAARVTKLLDEDGVLILEYVDMNAFDSGVAAAHPAQVLSDCEKIFGAP